MIYLRGLEETAALLNVLEFSLSLSNSFYWFSYKTMANPMGKLLLPLLSFFLKIQDADKT